MRLPNERGTGRVSTKEQEIHSAREASLLLSGPPAFTGGRDHLSGTGETGSELDALAIELAKGGLVVRRDELMSRHTTYRIGGPADVFVIAESREQLLYASRVVRDRGITPFVLGGGANLLVADAGIRGVVITYRGRQRVFGEADGEVLLWAEAGALLSDLARESVARGLEGIEWAVDVPGTIGGAVVGNAGAFGGYICDSLRQIEALEPDGTVHHMWNADIEFCYRSSKLKKQPREARTIVLSVTLALRHGDVAKIRVKAAQHTQYRKERHPVEPSCGSVFKRAGNYPAGFLIEQCGLKGSRQGDAVISPKHANYIVNLGAAKASDVRSLIELAQREVKAQFGEELELEVELVGEWGKNGSV